ncbi:MAG: hypothetical protein ACYS67_12360 [Planctomycetota bacterium]|jgi:hypothetical protein
MWIQAVCSAEYTDSGGELRKVELTHWLTDLTKEQTQQILARQEEEKERLAEETEGMFDELGGADPNEILNSMLPDDLL